jgi:hypothetical protein
MILKRISIACLGISTLFSCSNDSKSIDCEPKFVAAGEIETEEIQIEDEVKSSFRDWTDEGGGWLDLPLDTAQLIADMNLVDKGNRIDLIGTDSEKSLLSKKIDTFEMYRVTYGCVCPDWNVLDCDNTSDNGYSGPCQYYMEPAHKSLEINIPYDQLNSNVRFIGKKYLKDGDYGESSHAGQRFKYYSFEFIKPYLVYGPRKNDTLFRNNRMDTTLQTISTYLTVD